MRWYRTADYVRHAKLATGAKPPRPQSVGGGGGGGHRGGRPRKAKVARARVEGHKGEDVVRARGGGKGGRGARLPDDRAWPGGRARAAVLFEEYRKRQRLARRGRVGKGKGAVGVKKDGKRVAGGEVDGVGGAGVGAARSADGRLGIVLEHRVVHPAALRIKPCRGNFHTAKMSLSGVISTILPYIPQPPKTLWKSPNMV